VASFRANLGGHDYSAAKAGIRQLTVTAANELGEHGVRVNAICPGGVATAIFGRAAGLDGDAAQRTVELMSLALSDIAPIRRAGQPIDIAEAVLWLASDAAGYVNGQAIAVDGGLLTGSLRRSRPVSRDDLLTLLRQAAEQADA
jgi:NAD(P)-dependent dehydrogenase (short-subunit alcohol dehydrogenase family)